MQLQDRLMQLTEDKQTHLDWLDVCDPEDREQVLEIISQIEEEMQDLAIILETKVSYLYWTKQGQCRFVKMPSMLISTQAEKKALRLGFMSNANLEYFYATRCSTGWASTAHMAKYEEYKALARSVV